MEALNGFSNKICISNKTEDINLHVFNMATIINKSKPTTKHMTVNKSWMVENII